MSNTNNEFVICNTNTGLYRGYCGTWVFRAVARRVDQDLARRICMSLADSGECDLDSSKVEPA